MNGKYRILIVIITILFIWKSFQFFAIFSKNQLLDTSNNNKKNIIDKIRISVYYEALCPDSKFFIMHQLLPTYKNLHDHLELDFIPYGKAQTVETNGKIEFYCQHDAVECFANKIHSCVINLISDQMLQIKYISCMINDNMIPDDAGEKCGNELHINYTPISDCANSVNGSKLLKMYGERTHSLNPPVKFIPTIELNGSQTVVSQSAILKDLSKAICQIFKNKPEKCGW